MVNLNHCQGLSDYLNDVSNVPFAVGPSNGSKGGFALEREKRNYEFGTIVQKYLLTERKLLEKIEGLEEKTEPGASLKIPKGHTCGEIVRGYKRQLRSARKKLEEHRRNNGSPYTQAKQGLSESCLLLVVNWAKKYAEKSGLNISDLVGYGNKGLMRATEKFDPKRGYQFSTYASYWIRQSITRGIANEESKGDLAFSYPVYKKRGRISEIERLLSSELSRQPSEEEIARRYNKVHSPKNPKDKIDREAVRALRDSKLVLRLSLLGREEDSDFEIRDTDTEAPYQIAARNERFQGVLDYLDNSGNFNINEKEVVKYRFGLEGRASMTLREVGAQLELTRERIKQIEAKALKKLKLYFNPEDVVQPAEEALLKKKRKIN